MVEATVKSITDFGAGFLTRFPGPDTDGLCQNNDIVSMTSPIPKDIPWFQLLLLREVSLTWVKEVFVLPTISTETRENTR